MIGEMLFMAFLVGGGEKRNKVFGIIANIALSIRSFFKSLATTPFSSALRWCDGVDVPVSSFYLCFLFFLLFLLLTDITTKHAKIPKTDKLT